MFLNVAIHPPSETHAVEKILVGRQGSIGYSRTLHPAEMPWVFLNTNLKKVSPEYVQALLRRTLTNPKKTEPIHEWHGKVRASHGNVRGPATPWRD